MRIGEDNFFPAVAQRDGSTKRGPGDTLDFAAALLLDPGQAHEKSEGSVWSGGQRDPVQAANDALALEFLDWAQKTPEEKIRERILKAKGLDEESLKELPKAERDAIEDEIRAAVKQAFGVMDDKGAEAAASDRLDTSSLP